MKTLKSFEDFAELRKKLAHEGVLAPDKKRIKVCCGTACRANNSIRLVDELHAEVRKNSAELEIVTTGCQGLCQLGPVMTIDPQGYFYQKVKPERAGDIVFRTSGNQKP